MRVGVDVRALSVPMFGIGRYTWHILNELVSYPDTHWILYSDRPILHRLGDLKNVEYREYKKHNKFASLYRTQVSFGRMAAQDNLDLFWSPRHHLPLKLPKSVKSVVTIHDMVWRKFPQTMSLANLWVERFIMPRSLRAANSIIAVSESTRRDIIDYDVATESRISVIYEGFATDTVPAERQLEQSYFLFVGTLEPRKNIQSSLLAYRKYRQTGGEKKLLIVGATGWKMARQEDEIGVKFLGRVSEAVLHSCYKYAFAFLYPSLYEGFGLPALEAMSYGVPVIGSDSSSIPEVVGEGGLLINPLDIDEIIGAMFRLETESGLHEELSQKALLRAKDFDWKAAASATMQQLKNVVTLS